MKKSKNPPKPSKLEGEGNVFCIEDKEVIFNIFEFLGVCQLVSLRLVNRDFNWFIENFVNSKAKTFLTKNKHKFLGVNVKDVNKMCSCNLQKLKEWKKCTEFCKNCK